MIKNINIPYYVILIIIFILLKFIYTSLETNDLLFLLKPTSQVIEMLTNSDSQFISEEGYFNQKLNILINKSCSGVNFWLLCFVMLSFLAIKYYKKRSIKLISIPVILFASYLLTIFVNSSRILFSIFIHKLKIPIIEHQKDWTHQAEGTFVYLSFLIIFYLTFEFYLIKKKLS